VNSFVKDISPQKGKKRVKAKKLLLVAAFPEELQNVFFKIINGIKIILITSLNPFSYTPFF